MSGIYVSTCKKEELFGFLKLNDFAVEDLGSLVYRVSRQGELPVFLRIDGSTLYFEVDLGNCSGFADRDFYFQLLDMNTEILPVSFGINNTNPDDPRLVLVESREAGSLDDHELLSVFAAFELAADKAEALLGEYISE